MSTHDDKKNIYPFFYRVVRLPDGLYIKESAPQGFGIPDAGGEMVQTWEYRLIDTLGEQDYNIGSPNITSDGKIRRDIPEDISRKILNQLTEHLDSVPFYNFLGFGFVNKRYRNSFRISVNKNGKLEDIFSADGYLQRRHQEYLERVFSNAGPPKSIGW